MTSVASSVLHAIGNTPLVRLTRVVPPGAADEAAARDMARRLAREEGRLAGTSSGLNIVAAVQLAREGAPGRVVTTVAVDCGLKYLAGDLFATS